MLCSTWEMNAFNQVIISIPLRTDTTISRRVPFFYLRIVTSLEWSQVGRQICGCNNFISFENWGFDRTQKPANTHPIYFLSPSSFTDFNGVCLCARACAVRVLTNPQVRAVTHKTNGQQQQQQPRSDASKEEHWHSSSAPVETSVHGASCALVRQMTSKDITSGVVRRCCGLEWD